MIIEQLESLHPTWNFSQPDYVHAGEFWRVETTTKDQGRCGKVVGYGDTPECACDELDRKIEIWEEQEKDPWGWLLQRVKSNKSFDNIEAKKAIDIIVKEIQNLKGV